MPPTSITFLIFLSISIANALNASSPLVCSVTLNRCYIYSKSTSTFFDADKQCIDLGGHLASIHNQEENDFLLAIAKLYQGAISISPVWIGANNIPSTGWQWTDSSVLNYTSWQTPNQTSYCAVQYSYYGTWISRPCEELWSFVCLVPETPSILTPITTISPQSRSPCDLGWTFYEPTNSCYKVFHNSRWEDAESDCITHESHLVSIHSEPENSFVNNLASSGINDKNLTSLAWIGLHKVNGTWLWTDGSNTDYFKWASKKPDNVANNSCVQTSPDVTYNFWYEEWNNHKCTETMRAYICKKSSRYN